MPVLADPRRFRHVPFEIAVKDGSKQTQVSCYCICLSPVAFIEREEQHQTLQLFPFRSDITSCADRTLSHSHNAVYRAHSNS